MVYLNHDNSLAEVQSFPWYDDSYDKGYQAIVSATEISKEGNIIVTVQRDSEPVLYNPKNQKFIKKIELANRHGNPSVYVRKTANEVWIDDYDTLLKLNLTDLTVINKICVQPEPEKNHALFMGNFSFSRDETHCAIARPHSGDVIGIDTNSLKLTSKSKIGRNLLDVALLDNGHLIVRDWKTGDLITGQLFKY
ncbi:MAG: hypothetical protein NUK65_10150 [Firmicutes bacterium]|nr:hypothetical protein [Bacillota bacterium]